MTIPGLIIKRDTQSKTMLTELFDKKANPIACANYGGGNHCSEARVTAKINMWGVRGDNAQEGDCKVARILTIDSKPVGMFNVGVTGNPATVIDRAHGGSSVYELSGAFIKDSYFSNGFLNGAIASDIRSIISNCTAGEKYTKAIVTFVPEHPYQGELFASAGFAKLTLENVDSILGQNSLHPERFKFVDEQVNECITWSSTSTEVEHKNWHDSKPCVEWTEKTMMVSEVSAQHFQPYDEL